MAHKRTLTAKRVARLLSRGEIGNHYDRLGLRLEIRGPNSASWSTRYQVNHVVRWMGLGSARVFTLAEARERNRRVRQQLADDLDPLLQKRAAKATAAAAAARTISFADEAARYLKDNAASWGNAKHAAQWKTTLETYVNPIVGRLSVADIDTALVLEVLEQDVPARKPLPAGKFWNVRQETASRVRQRIEMVLNYATARQHRSGDNPAARSIISNVLKRSKKEQEHHAALPYDQLPAFMAELRQCDGVAARALEFTILTAARSGEALGAIWKEIKNETWTVPASRMKAGKEHTVPLSGQALKLLKSLPTEEDSDYLFVGRSPGTGLSERAMLGVLDRMGRDDIVVHGFRSTFRDWCAKQTNYPREVAEMALAHTVGNETERSYLHSKMPQKRRLLMQEWGKFCTSIPITADATGNEPIPIHGRRRK
jgi:integrase